MNKAARTLRAHRPLLLKWFRAKGAVSSGAVEGFNNKAKLTLRKSYGLRTCRAMEMALYHTLSVLPNRSLPTDSAEEAKFLLDRNVTIRIFASIL
ncbi:MAG: transposase [Acidobacteriota bacterium]